MAGTLLEAGGPDLTRAVELLASDGGPLLTPVRAALVAADPGWASVLDRLSPPVPILAERTLASGRPYRLDQVATHPTNPFRQENAALVLAVRLLRQRWPDTPEPNGDTPPSSRPRWRSSARTGIG